MDATSKRKVNWRKEEEIILVEEVTKREGLLFGRLDGSQRSTLKKTQAREEIACLINSRGRSGLRTLSEIKKKYQNIKRKAKAKRSLCMRPQTGGRPRANSPSVPEQLVLDNLEGRPSLCGVFGGIDTEDFVNISETAEAPHDGA
ncbi:uncharacterized protein LOC124285282 [Haliotis rubra]|uniref:uncharacterized protein LOC124285282 n=1 Tax=Haliotis rubra TaxID=36100 RepID=UPI001EE50284|nr:uncharacterized protein LOC124285282 [Haliotis rubra]